MLFMLGHYPLVCT